MNSDLDYRYTTCPRCGLYIYVEELNCGIFRCATLKQSFRRVNPHTPFEVIEKLLKEDLIYGCGAAFKLVIEDGKYISSLCSYEL